MGLHSAHDYEAGAFVDGRMKSSPVAIAPASTCCCLGSTVEELKHVHNSNWAVEMSTMVEVSIGIVIVLELVIGSCKEDPVVCWLRPMVSWSAKKWHIGTDADLVWRIWG